MANFGTYVKVQKEKYAIITNRLRIYEICVINLLEEKI